MSLSEVAVQGTLKPDGTLELDHKPNLSPGRVTVVLRPVLELPEGDPFFDLLKGIWATRARAGLTPRSVEEVESERKKLRDESAAEVARAMRLQEEGRGTPHSAFPEGEGNE
jgi:hypothetical protein